MKQTEPQVEYRRLLGVTMDKFTKEDLEEALRAIASTISKCEKVRPKLKQGTSQHTLFIRRIKALQIASSLIMQALESSDAPRGLSRN